MIKLLALLPGPNDGTSWYRGAGPFNAMRNEIEFDVAPADTEYDWSVLGQYDVIFMQRPFDNKHVNTATTALQMGKKLWVDYDDLLFEIPKDNPAYSLYMTLGVHANMSFFLNNAHVLTYSTEFLRDEMSKRQWVIPTDQIVEVIPNAFDNTLLKIHDFCEFNNLVWRGSHTHQNDIFVHHQDIVNAVNQNNTQVHFVGWNPFFISTQIKKSTHHEWKGKLMQYMTHLSRGNSGNAWGATYIVPLADNNFNRAKSNIAWIEATMAGACCIAPPWNEWEHSLRYNITDDENHVSVYDAVHSALTNETRRRKAYEHARDYITENLLLTDINKQRLAIFKKLIP